MNNDKFRYLKKFYNVYFRNDPIPTTSISVEKEWSNPEVDHNPVQIELIRYRKIGTGSNSGSGSGSGSTTNDPTMGTLVISHTASGLNNSALPEGFAVTYSYSGASSVSGLAAGSYEVPAGDYTVTATVTNSVAPEGYTYLTTTESVSVKVNADESTTAAFISTYEATHVQSTGTFTITKVGIPSGSTGTAFSSGSIRHPIPGTGTLTAVRS